MVQNEALWSASTSSLSQLEDFACVASFNDAECWHLSKKRRVLGRFRVSSLDVEVIYLCFAALTNLFNKSTFGGKPTGMQGYRRLLLLVSYLHFCW